MAAASGWKTLVACTPVGFANPDVRCYQNSLLQALLHSSAFVSWLKLHQKQRCSVRCCVACALGRLATAYWDGPKTTRQIAALIQNLMNATCDAGRSSNFGPWGKDRYYEHQDAHEYYQWLVNTMVDQLPNDAKRLEGIFGVACSSETECTKCHHKNSRPENGWNITVSCNDRGSLEHKLQSAEVFGEERLAGIECDSGKCQNRRVEKRKWTRIVEGPDLLCTQIARFEHYKGNPAKTNHHIAFHENLDLSPFVEAHAPLMYRLYGVVYHAGSLDFGHYVSATRTPSGGWEQQNDDHVESVSLEQVLAPGQEEDLGQWTPYLMFWEKTQSIQSASPKRSKPKSASPVVSPKRSKSKSASPIASPKRSKSKSATPIISPKRSESKSKSVSPITSPKRSKSRPASLKRARVEDEEDQGPEAFLGSPPKTTKTSHSPSSESPLGSLFETPSSDSSRSIRDSSEAEPAKTTPKSINESPYSQQTDPPPAPKADSSPPPKPKATTEPSKPRRSGWNFLWPYPRPDPSVEELHEKVKYLEAELEKTKTEMAEMASPYADLARTTDLLNRCCFAQAWLIDFYKSLNPKVPPLTISAEKRKRAWKIEMVRAVCFHRASELMATSLRFSELFGFKDSPREAAEKTAFDNDNGEAFERDELGEWLEAELRRLETPKPIKHR